MCRLLQAVVHQKAGKYEESVQYHEHSEPVEEVPEISSCLGETTYKRDDYSPQLVPSSVTKRVRLTPSLVDLHVSSTQSPTNLGPGKPIKEGLVEKKGHSVAFLMWPK